MVNPRVFFDISVDNSPIGRVIFELYADTAPKTCENFRALCTGEKGLSSISERLLYYKGSIIHRSIKDFMIQGGDFTKRNGMGGESIYGSPFADEDLTRPLDSEGLLCMANKGPNTNGSQFFVTLRDCPHLNGKHVVFGRVIRGYEEVVKKITEVKVDEKDRPMVPVSIVNCGELVLKAKVPKPEEVKAKESEDESQEESDRSGEKHKKRRHRRRSSSRSPASDASEDEDRSRHKKRRSKKSKSKHRRDKDRPASHDRGGSSEKREPEEETEEQYDARLEREENERLEAARRKELERLKREAESVVSKDGVRFKGRGRMKYLDPELSRS
ncbi:hypothetical protein EIP91_006258 [Steccherinum ochraceum]|uniref:Peptidyl-prolyl cis-trans isomerase D n=1 Tax=Steccherinum ochraceum TaxID=92696 RepID=A0A4R0R5Z8_9APHY|nr:hypothetical protein EIP91_006258 [Steccherinum ochraceum]